MMSHKRADGYQIKVQEKRRWRLVRRDEDIVVEGPNPSTVRLYLYSSLWRGPIRLAPFLRPLLPLGWEGRGAANIHDRGGVGIEREERRECSPHTLAIPERKITSLSKAFIHVTVVVQGIVPTVEGGSRSK